MRISDWSSDVCSSDLLGRQTSVARRGLARAWLSGLMAFLDRKTAITGIGASRFERRPEASVLDFAGEALNAALADAGLDTEQIDGLVVQVGSPRGADYDTIALTFGQIGRAHVRTPVT